MISIITTTYNRAQLLDCLYQSLVRQTDYDFEWVVIDDGSIDDTAQVVEDFISKTNRFKIHYFKQLNGGKHRAINRGVELAKGQYCLIVDSDDYLDDQAVAKIKEWIASIADLEKFAGVAGLRASFDQVIIGQAPNSDYVDCTNLQRQKYHLMGDKAEVYKTEILRQYPFPEFEGEKFLSEAVVWNQIAEAGYRLRWFNQVIYYCEYLEGGLTKTINQRHKASPRGFALYVKQLIKHEPCLFKKSWLMGLYARDVYDYQNLKQAALDLQQSVLLVWLGVLMRKFLRK